MKTNLENKYKDKTPEETILNIKNFFFNKGFVVEEKIIKNPVPNIWWCRIILKYKDKEIQGANGKGTTKLFALASGHAELYERYCNLQNPIFCSTLNSNKFYELSYQEKGYCLSPDEVFLSAETAINISPRIINFCNSINDNRNSLLKYFQTNYEKGILSLPFQGLNINSTITLPLNLLFMVAGSSGSAAGNTIEEALVQGCSELCEHYVENAIYNEKRPFKKINLDKIDFNSKIKEYFQKLKDNNYSYSLFDFSYLYNMPVIGLYIIDLKKKVAFLNLGSSPIFEIALERCCTEIYQGHEVLGDNLKNIMRSVKEIPINEVLADCFSISFIEAYPDNFLLNFDIVDNFNTKIFKEAFQYTNIELTNYYKELFNSLGWEVFYRDFSQSNDIKAVKIYVNNVDVKNAPTLIKNNAIPTLVKKRKWDIVFKWNQIVEEYLKTKTINNTLLKEYSILKKADQTNNFFITDGTLFKFDLYSIFGLVKNVNINFDMLFNSLLINNAYGHFLNDMSTNEKEYNELTKYSILFNFKDEYTVEEIKKIAKAFDIEYTENDLANRKDILYYLDKLYFELYYNYYNSTEYETMLINFIP